MTDQNNPSDPSGAPTAAAETPEPTAATATPPATETAQVPETESAPVTETEGGAPAATAETAAAKPKPKSKKKKGGGARKGPPAPKLHKGTITRVEDGKVHVEFGPKVHGVIEVSEYDEAPEVGAEQEFAWISVEDGVWKLDRSEARTRELWAKLAEGQQVEAKVIGENSGGLELRVGSIAAFMPSSQIDVDPVKDKKALFGQAYTCQVLEVNRKRKRLVLSRRALLEKDLRAQREVALANIAEGATLSGKVKRLEPFGAIVDLGNGLSGLIHVSNISHQRVQTPGDVLKVGQDVEVKVLEIKSGGKKIGLGMKQLQADPWSEVAKKYREGSRHTGKVIRAADFGAFIELEKGIEGLAHISELAKDRVERVADVAKEGEEVLVRVVKVEASRKRIGLSRLNRQGELLGSEEDSEEDEGMFDALQAPPSDAERGTNLGDLLRKALEGQ